MNGILNLIIMLICRVYHLANIFTRALLVHNNYVLSRNIISGRHQLYLFIKKKTIF